jgi:hypothetical protein
MLQPERANAFRQFAYISGTSKKENGVTTGMKPSEVIPGNN